MNIRSKTNYTFFAFSLVVGVLSTVQGTELSKGSPQIQQFERGLLDKMKRGVDQPTLWTIEDRLTALEVPGVAVAIIQQGEVVWEQGYGRLQAGSNTPVNADTLFSVGSVSKLVNAALILRLAAQNKVNLDTDVNTYLTSWKVPQNQYSKTHQVTLRHLLSHRGGFNVHGFDDYLPGEQLPSAVQTLNGETPAKNAALQSVSAPGQTMRYSGGGITITQVLVEDVTGLSYNEAAKRYVFAPLGMSRSTFENPLPINTTNVAKSHDEYGNPMALPRGYEAMPEMAASGLWTNVGDLSRLIIALMYSIESKDGYLPQALAKEMLSRAKNSWFGLGPKINGQGPTRVFHHGGANDGYRSWVEGHPTAHSGIVILTNGTDGHWIYKEIRKSAEDAFDWPVKSDGGFEEPEF